MKILGVFPEIVTRGGCERSLLALAERFDMDILLNRFEPEKSYDGWSKISDRVISLDKKSKFDFGLSLAKKKFLGYDLFYSHGYFITNFISVKNSPCVWYCHTPKRDLYPPTAQFHLRQMPIAKKIPFAATAPFMRALDKFLARRMDKVVSNSENVSSRVRRAYGLETEVVYSTCIEKIQKTKFGDFYFYPGRIASGKRIEIAMNAFRKMPGKKLVVAGSAIDKKYLEFLKKIKPNNVEILTDVSEKGYEKLYSSCLATICLAENEDFGFVPPESFSFGKPCIAADEGGFRESIVNGKNGLLIDRNEISLAQAIKNNENLFPKMSAFCLKSAERFTKKIYLEKMERVFESALKI